MRLRAVGGRIGRRSGTGPPGGIIRSRTLCPGRIGHAHQRSHRGPQASLPLEPSDHRRGRTLGRVRAAHARGVPPHRRRHGGGGPGPGEPAHPQLARDVRGRAAPPPDRPGSVLVPADQEHARPGDGHAAAPHVRAPRRPRSRLLRGLPHGGTRLLPPAAGAAAPGPLPRVQRVHGRAVPPVQRPHHPRRDHPDVLAGGGDRGAGVRVEAARLQGRHDGRPHPPPHPRAGRGASRGLAVRRVVRRDRHRQRARLRSGVGRSAASCASRRASTTAPARSCSATHRRTSATTTSATSPRPARPWPRPSSSAASPGASRS